MTVGILTVCVCVMRFCRKVAEFKRAVVTVSVIGNMTASNYNKRIYAETLTIAVLRSRLF